VGSLVAWTVQAPVPVAVASPRTSFVVVSLPSSSTARTTISVPGSAVPLTVSGFAGDTSLVSMRPVRETDPMRTAALSTSNVAVAATGSAVIVAVTVATPSSVALTRAQNVLQPSSPSGATVSATTCARAEPATVNVSPAWPGRQTLNVRVTGGLAPGTTTAPGSFIAIVTGSSGAASAVPGRASSVGATTHSVARVRLKDPSSVQSDVDR
jgi:hypothetical protein